MTQKKSSCSSCSHPAPNHTPAGCRGSGVAGTPWAGVGECPCPNKFDIAADEAFEELDDTSDDSSDDTSDDSEGEDASDESDAVEEAANEDNSDDSE